MAKKRKPRAITLIEDECLACLAYFAYRTDRVERKVLVAAFVEATRLDEPTEAPKRKGWWNLRLDNVHCAFKKHEGTVVRGRTLSKTDKKGAKSGDGVQEGIAKYALNYFLNDFPICIELARRALDAPLPAGVERAVFEDAEGLPSGSYLSPGDVQALEEASPEGVRKLRQHWYLERDSSLPRKAKEAFFAKNGELYCEVCGLRPVPTYGYPLVDAHHRLPLSGYAALGKTLTSLSDFAILCPTCHRAVHKQVDCDVDAIKASIPKSGVVFRDKS
jgi:hypothetical protein